MSTDKKYDVNKVPARENKLDTAAASKVTFETHNAPTAHGIMVYALHEMKLIGNNNSKRSECLTKFSKKKTKIFIQKYLQTILTLPVTWYYRIL